MTNSRSLVDFIKQFEGRELDSYQDSAGVWTIGFGTTKWFNGNAITEGMEISPDVADNLLMGDLQATSTGVEHMTRMVALNQNQFDALVDFAYNCGLGALAGSTLLKKIVLNPIDSSIEAEFLKWDKIHRDGQLVALPGLKLRRQAESDLYFTNP